MLIWTTADCHLEPFNVFEQKYPELVSYDSDGIRINTLSFWEKERAEMQLMSCATEITTNVWVRLSVNQ